jgi:hypothetical protein
MVFAAVLMLEDTTALAMDVQGKLAVMGTYCPT